MKKTGSGEKNTYNTPKNKVGGMTKKISWGKGKNMDELIGAKKVGK